MGYLNKLESREFTTPRGQSLLGRRLASKEPILSPGTNNPIKRVIVQKCDSFAFTLLLLFVTWLNVVNNFLDSPRVMFSHSWMYVGIHVSAMFVEILSAAENRTKCVRFLFCRLVAPPPHFIPTEQTLFLHNIANAWRRVMWANFKTKVSNSARMFWHELRNGDDSWVFFSSGQRKCDGSTQ